MLRHGIRRWCYGLIASLALMVPLGLQLPVHALDAPPAPKDVPLVDQTGTLTQQQIAGLADKISSERKATGNQIGVLMIGSLQGDALEDYSLKVARGWGIGQKDRDSGVLLVVVKDDRKLRIEVGYGLEGVLPDIRAAQIIRDRITPEFRKNNYYAGINSGLDGIISAIHGEKDPQLGSGTTDSKNSGSIWGTLAAFSWVFILIPVWLGSVLGRTKSWWAGGVIGAGIGLIIGIFAGFLFWGVAAIVSLAAGGLLFDWAVSRNYKKAASGGSDGPSWWAGGPWLGGGTFGGGSGGDGGDFGGFSGGSFGGGGSSGSW